MRYPLALSFLLTCSAYAADTAPNPETMQAAMEQMSKTGAEHAALTKPVGEWNVQASSWMMPGAPAMTSSGTATFTALLDGKWIRQDYRGEMMNKPYIGVGMSGFDTTDKRYVATWADNFSTAMSFMNGSSTDGGKTITYTSEMKHCPMTGGPLSMRHVLVNESADKMIYTMYSTPKGGAEQKGMELVYTRKTAAK